MLSLSNFQVFDSDLNVVIYFSTLAHRYHTQPSWPTTLQVVQEAHQDRSPKTPKPMFLVHNLR